MATTPYTYNLQRLSPGIYRDKMGGLATQKTLNKANNQFNTWANQLKGLQYGTKEYHDTATNLSKYGKQYGYNTKGLFNPAWKGGKWVEPTPTNTTPAPTEASPVAPEAPQQQPAPSQPTGSPTSPMTQALMNALGQGLNTMQAYEPKNFEGSPMYQFQKQKGMQDLEKLMAARGLTNSGAEVQANSDFLANLNATEAEKQRQYADQAAQRAQNAMQFIANYDQAERSNLIDQQQNEAQRGDRRQEVAINFLNNLLGIQSQNDIARISQGGLNDQTDLTKALMSAITNNIGANVPRVSGGGVPAPPPPSSAAGNNALAQILAEYGNSAGNNDVFNTILKTLFS